MEPVEPMEPVGIVCKCKTHPSGTPGRLNQTLCISCSPLDEGLWDILIKDIPKEVTSYTLNLDMLREGVTYDFRVIGVNDYGYGSPSAPSPSISG